MISPKKSEKTAEKKNEKQRKELKHDMDI